MSFMPTNRWPTGTWSCSVVDILRDTPDTLVCIYGLLRQEHAQQQSDIFLGLGRTQ